MKSKYFNNLTAKEILSETIVYDNGGESYDRYTIFTPDGSVFGMNEDARGFNQFLGDHSEFEEGSHLGKKLKGVPKGIKNAVLNRMIEDEANYGHGGSIPEGNYRMMLSQAKEVQHHIEELQNILMKEDDIEAWVVAKMENVSSTLSDITHYLDGKTEYADGGEVDDDDLIEDDDNEYANGGQTTIPIQVVIDGNFDEPKFFKTFSLAKKFVLDNVDKYDMEILDSYGDSIYVEKNSTKRDLDFLFGDTKYSNGGSLEDMRKKYELNQMMVRSKVALAIGIDKAIRYLDEDFVVSPYSLLEGAVNKGFIDAQEIDKNLWESALSEAYRIDSMYRDSGEGIGSSDMNAFISSMLNDAGIKIEVVNNRYERVGGKFAKGGKTNNKYYASIITHNQNVEPYISVKPQTLITKTKEEMVEKLNELYKKTFSHNYSPYAISDFDEKYAIEGTYISDDWAYVTNDVERFKEIHKIHLKDFSDLLKKNRQAPIKNNKYAKGGGVGVHKLTKLQEKLYNRILNSPTKSMTTYNLEKDVRRALEDLYYMDLIDRKYIGSTQEATYTLKEKYAKGGEVEQKFILSFNYNPSNLSNKEAEKIVSKYTKNWKHDNDFDEVSFFVMDLKKSQADELKQDLKMEDVYNIEIQKSRYAKGGEVESTIDILMTEEPKVWDKFDFNSGGEIRASKEKTKKYAEELEKVFSKKGIKRGSLSEKIYEELQDENFHLLNEFLTRNGYFKKATNDKLIKTYENPIYVGAYADKDSITIQDKANSNPKPTTKKKIQRKKLSARTKYIPNRDIKEIELKSGEEIAGSKIVDGVYKKK